MLNVLASADAVTWLSILVKAGAYCASLLAAGSVLVLLGLRALPFDVRPRVAWTGAGAALCAAVLSVLRLPLRAGFLSGGTLAGGRDPMLLGMVLDSPLGDAVTLRLIGLGLICAVLVHTRMGLWAAGAGAGLVAMSFAMRGHALEEPRLLLAALVAVHILALAFWIGALGPLGRMARSGPPKAAGALAHEFGAKALWVVGALAVAGAGMLALFGTVSLGALQTPYGQSFALKLALFAGLLSLAALNKLRLTPALLSDAPGASAHLRHSIRCEAALIALILLVTAAVTTVSSPPGERAAALTADDGKMSAKDSEIEQRAVL